MEMKQAISNMKHKLDQDIFDDEIQQIRDMARTASVQAAASASPGQAANASPTPAQAALPKGVNRGGGGGMSKSERLKLRETAEAVERIEVTQ